MITLRRLDSRLICDDYLNAMKDIESIKFTGARFTVWDLEGIRNYVSQNGLSNTSVLLGIYNLEQHIGNVRVHAIDKMNSTCELGIMVFGATRHGKGYGTAALKLAIHYIEQELKISRIMADYFEENLASAKIFNRNGFIQEGTFIKHFANKDGTFSNSVRVALNLSGRI
jgi:RimJ/RimL family protein N-acetyltransferase